MTNQQGAPEALALARAVDHWARCDYGLRGDEMRKAAAELRRLHYENERLAALVEAQHPATHVQNPAEIEHVAGDVSKNGAELNVSTKQQECGNTPYDEGPFALAQPVAQRGAADGFFLLLPQRPKPKHSPLPEATTAPAAPASVLHLVHSAFAEIAMAFPKAFALHKVGIADTAVREALTAPATQQAGEVSDAMVLAALQMQHPAAYGQYLRHPANGPKTSIRTEAEIDTARRMIAAALAAAPQPSPTPRADSQPAPVLDYPPLPRVGAIGYASVVDIDSYAKTLTIGPHLPGVRDIALWTTDQMRAYADETYALRIGTKHA